MKKFRNLKAKLVGSKRDSQKLDEIQINKLKINFQSNGSRFSKVNESLQLKLKNDMMSITPDSYKINQNALHKANQSERKVNNNSMSNNKQFIENYQDREKAELELIRLISESSTLDDEFQSLKNQTSFRKYQNIDTFHSQKNIDQGQNQLRSISQNFEDQQTLKKQCKDLIKTSFIEKKENQYYKEIIEMMSELNKLEQRKKIFEQNGKRDVSFESLSGEISEKMLEIKSLIQQIQKNVCQKSSQSPEKMYFDMDEDIRQQSLSEQQQISTKRHYQVKEQIREFKEEREQLSIKYTRINANSYQSFEFDGEQAQQYINQTFQSQVDAEDDEEHSPFDQLQQSYEMQYENRNNQTQIVHLFSYSKEKCCEGSLLSKITQRSSEDHSPDHSSIQNSRQLQEETLEYKKILYMLETTERKKTNHEIKSHNKSRRLQFTNKLEDLSKISALSSRFFPEKLQNSTSSINSYTESSQASNQKQNIKDDIQFKELSIENKKKEPASQPNKRETLKDIVNLLQHKYNRKVNLERKQLSEINKSLSTAMDDHKIKSRQRVGRF